MLRRIVRLAAFAGFAFVSPASAALPTAEEIVAHYVDAIGGAAAVAAIHSTLIRGVYTENGHSDDHAVLARMKPFYKLVGDPDHRSSDFMEGYDGSAWEFYGDPGIVVRTVGAASAAARHGLYVMGDLVDYKAHGSTIVVLGVEKIDGQDAYHLRVRMLDGFEKDEFVDAKSWLIVADRKVAKVHAFGTDVASETRWSDYRAVNGVLFAFLNREVALSDGHELNRFQTTAIEVNRDWDPALFAPPVLKRTRPQTLLDQMFLERTDTDALLWTYHDYKMAYPDEDTDITMQIAGYQILKMGDVTPAIALLEANAAAYPQSSDAQFGLGRAYNTDGQKKRARAAFERALALKPDNKRAKDALAALNAPPEK
ncbi:MAG TPA: tetratricopeptide repeat protein [Rhizomicrobium sp.]|jgi:hypothetical protein|nr:tetratricopeptide repeat protein [Rhizomicrobium sp.]